MDNISTKIFIFNLVLFIFLFFIDLSWLFPDYELVYKNLITTILLLCSLIFSFKENLNKNIRSKYTIGLFVIYLLLFCLFVFGTLISYSFSMPNQQWIGG